MSTANTERLLALLQAFINAPSWAESRRIVEGAPELLTEEADAFLGHNLAQYQEDAGAVRILEEHRDLLRRCRAEGVEAAFAGRGDAEPHEHLAKASAPSGEAELANLLIEWVQTATWADSEAFLESHPELLTEGAQEVLAGLIAIQEEEEARRTLREHLALLRRCRAKGVESAFADRISITALPSGMRAVFERLGPDLGQQLQEIFDRASSQEAFAAELDRRPELREALAQASAGTAPGLSDVPTEITLIVQELNRPGQRADMPRRIRLCRQALRQLDREQDRALWAALQNELASSLAQTPVGDRADNLEQAIHHFSQALEVFTRQADPEGWAMTQNNLAIAYSDRIRGDRADNLEWAIHHYNQALGVRTQQAFPADWAATQNNLANAYSNRIRGDRADNLERAIHHYSQALAIRTHQAFPSDWAMTQNNLATAYGNRIRGDRADNLERAIQHHHQALEVYTRQAFPADWAMTQNNLANVYANRIRGDRADNLERAIQHYSQALEVRTRQAFPSDWAMTQNNLATAYGNRIRGDRADNLERAIQHHHQALEVFTRQAFPSDWAMTQNSLANACRNRIRGDRADNLDRAIHHYSQALEVSTRQADPADWAGIQNNLAIAHTNRIRGDRADNLERAIHHASQALEVYTRQADPKGWAMTQSNLANAYGDRIRGNRADNLERAIQHHHQALEVYTRQAFPADWAMTQSNLALAYSNRIRGDRAESLERAIHHYTQALEVRTRRSFPADWARTVNNLAIAYANRIRGDRAGNLEQAIHHFSQALEVRTRQTLPADWAQTVNNLANAYTNRIRGDRAESLERAIHHYTQALEVYTRRAFPADWAQTVNNLAIAYVNRIRGDRAGNLEQAIHHFSQALEVRTRQTLPADWAMTQNNLAAAYVNLSRGNRADNLEQAILHCTQALEVCTRQANPDHWAGIQNNLAIAYVNRIRGDRADNLERAVRHCNQALEVYTPQIWPERTRDLARTLGTAHFATGNWPVAHAAFVQSRALTEHFYADALLREVREQEAGANAALYAQDAFCLAQLGDLPAAWTSLETGRARALRQGLDRARARRALASASPALREQYETLTGWERALRDSLQRPESDAHYQPYHLVREELETVTQELHSLQEELLVAAGIETGLPSLEAVRALPVLQDGHTGLLSLGVTERGTLALLLTARELQQAVISDLTEADMHTLIQGQYGDPTWGGWLGAYWQAAHERWQDTISETLDVLGRCLWPALDAMLQDAGCERILLVPQGMLFLLPLHACPLDGEERVCDRYTVAYTPSGTILTQLVQDEVVSDSPHALLVANPTGDLCHSPSEALAVGQTFDASTTLWEQDATQVRLVKAAHYADVLHVSGHGIYDWLEPERSGLILTPEEAVGESESEGNLFTVAEMRDDLRLSRARLVTLSACETGLVELRRGLADEYLGLPGTLLQAGVRAVVASLWAVDDLATTLLMHRFYVEWQAGAVSIAAALQRAQAWLRTRSRAQVEEALDEMDGIWEPWRRQEGDPAMKRRAVEQYWEILAARRRLRDEMPDPPFAHPYWWAAFQAVGDVL